MAVADLSLALNVQSSGTAEIDKLVSALNKYVDKVEEAKKKTGEAPSSAGFEQWAEKVKTAIQNPLQAAGNAAESLLKTLGPVGTGMALFGGAAIAAGVAAVSVAHQMGDLGLSIQNTALRMGLSTKEVGQFTFAAKVAGSDIGSLEGAMRRLSLGLADSGADGEKARRGLAALGVSARDANGEIRPMNDVFLDISKGLSAMGNAAERNAAAVKVFGRAGIELIPVLTGLQENVAKAKEMGLGLDENTVKGLDEVHKLLSGIEAQWAELARKPKIALTLELGAVMKWFQGKDHTGITAVKEWFLGEDRDLNDPRSPYARARDAFRTKDNTVGPATPQERETERYWNERFSSPEWQAKELTGQLALYEGRTDPDSMAHAASLRKAIAEQQDLASGAGRRILDQALASGGPNVNEQLKAARKNLESVEGEARGMAENKGGATSQAAQDMAARLADAKSQIARFEAQKKTAEEAAAAEKRRQAAIDALTKRGAEFGMGPIERAVADAQALGAGAQAPLDALLFGRGWTGGRPSGGMVGAELNKPVDLIDTGWDERLKTTSEQFVKDLKEATKPDEEELRKSMGVYDVMVGLQKTLIESGLSKTLAGTSGKFLGKAEDPIDALASRKQAANDIYKIEVDRAMLAQTSGERELDLARALAELKRSLWSAEDQHIADVEKAAQDAQQRAEQMAGGLFAGLTNKKGPGFGLQQYGLGQLNQLEGQMFTNLLTSSMSDANGNATGPLEMLQRGLGKMGGAASGGSDLLTSLFKGTMFDKDRGKDVVKLSVDAATKSVIALTSSVDTLTGTLGGTAPDHSMELGSLLPLVAGGGFGGGAGGATGALGAALKGFTGSGAGGGSSPPLSTLLSGIFGPSVSGNLPAGYQAPATDWGSVLGIVPNGFSGGLNPIEQLGAMADAAGLPGPTNLNGAASVDVGAIAKSAQSLWDPIKRLLNPSAADNQTTSQKAIGDVAKGVAAGFEIYNGVKTGGAKGGVEDAAGALMAGAMIPGPVGMALGAAGAVLSLVSSMFGDPKVARQNQINNELTDWHYFQPQALSSMMDGSGDLVNYDARGNVRGTPYSGWRFDTTQSHYGAPLNGQPTPIPGSVQPVYVQVSTMDSKSFNDNANLIAGAMQTAIQNGHPVTSSIRATVGVQ